MFSPVELGNKSASVIEFDVSTQPVSIHRPLSRFIAGLYLQLHRHGLSYHGPEFLRPDKPKPEPEELMGMIIFNHTVLRPESTFNTRVKGTAYNL